MDQLTGEKLYKSPEKKLGTKDEKQRAMSPYLKSFVKKIDPENIIKEGIRSQENATKRREEVGSPMQDQGEDHTWERF